MKIQFTDVYDLVYHLIMTMGLAIDRYDNHLYNQDDCSTLAFNGKIIKATVTPQPIYPGKDDIILDIYNYSMINKLFCLYLDKAQVDPDIMLPYQAHFIEDENKKRIFKEEKLKQRAVVRTTKGDIISNYYNNLCLAFIELIFKIDNSLDVDLSNFDIIQNNKE